MTSSSEKQIATPRTDEAAFDLEDDAGYVYRYHNRFGSYVDPNFARQLEQELASAKHAIEETITSQDAVCDSYATENQQLSDLLASAERRAKEIRQETIEECAKVCEDEISKIRRYDSKNEMSVICGALVAVAFSIRALKP